MLASAASSAPSSAASANAHYIFLEVSAGLIIAIILGIAHWAPKVVDRKLKAAVETVLSEVKPNGGNTTSLGDTVLNQGQALARVEEGVAGIYPRMLSIEAEQGRVATNLTTAATVQEAVIAAIHTHPGKKKP